jgi:hypothetical protein
MLAKQADKYSLIRSMTHGSNAHETAAYTVQTGRPAGGRDVFPGVGAVVSLFKGLRRRLQGPAPALHRADRAPGPVLRIRFPRPEATNPSPPAATPAARFVVEGVVAQGISDERQKARRELLHQLNTFERATQRGDPRLAAFGQCESDAYEMILGDAGKVFDLARKRTPCASVTAATPSASPASWPAGSSNAACRM